MPIEVNGVTIGEKELEAEFNRMKPSYMQHAAQTGETPNLDRLRDWCKDRLIERELLQQEAARRFPDKGKEALRDLINELTANVSAPTEQELRNYYDGHPQYFRRPERIHASHLVKHGQNGIPPGLQAETELLNAAQQLRKGVPLETVARQVSDCPDRGGDLGTFPRGQMVQEFEDVVFAMQPGEVSDVFESPFGLHVAIVHERFPEETISFDSIKEQLSRQWLDDRKQQVMDNLVKQLREKATIKQ